MNVDGKDVIAQQQTSRVDQGREHAIRRQVVSGGDVVRDLADGLGALAALDAVDKMRNQRAHGQIDAAAAPDHLAAFEPPVAKHR